jgi:hypothetical protein
MNDWWNNPPEEDNDFGCWALTENSRLLGIIFMSKDCWGDDLYDKITELGFIDEPFEVEPSDVTHIAVMASSRDLSLDWYPSTEDILLTFDGIPGHIEIYMDYGLVLVDSDLVDFIPSFDHESYDESFPVALSDLLVLDPIDTLTPEKRAALESSLFGIYLDQLGAEED